jgi:hypothetical protein
MYVCLRGSPPLCGSRWKTHLGKLGNSVWRWELLRYLADVGIDGT